MYYILQKDIKRGRFLMIYIAILQLYSFILIFTNKNLNKPKHKFIKRTIHQFFIELSCRIVADKRFNSFVNIFLKNLLRPFINRVFAWNFVNFKLGSIKPQMSLNFVNDLFFNTTDVFLSFNINVIFVYYASPWCN